jgi:hypothetical protein
MLQVIKEQKEGWGRIRNLKLELCVADAYKGQAII